MLGNWAGDAGQLGTAIGGVAAVIVALVTAWKAREASLAAKDAAAVSTTELKEALQAHSREMLDHVTASRVQTIRYVDRKIEQLATGQEILFGLLAEVDGKVTKKANSTKPKDTRILVSAETKGNHQ